MIGVVLVDYSSGDPSPVREADVVRPSPLSDLPVLLLDRCCGGCDSRTGPLCERPDSFPERVDRALRSFQEVLAILDGESDAPDVGTSDFFAGDVVVKDYY